MYVILCVRLFAFPLFSCLAVETSQASGPSPNHCWERSVFSAQHNTGFKVKYRSSVKFASSVYGAGLTRIAGGEKLLI